MGRDSTSDRDLRQLAPEPVKLSLQRVRLDSGGYDSGGAYWGQGAPLYRAADDAGLGEVTLFIRARDREHAKALVLAKLPNACFYR
jgi:hypothetical protein